MNDDQNARLVVLFVVAAALFNYPLLLLTEQEGAVWGAPRPVVYFFGMWVLMIAALILLNFRRKRPKKR